jgi:integrase
LTAASKPTVIQLSLGILGIPPRAVSRPKHRAPSQRVLDRSGHALVDGFVRRLIAVGASAKTRQAYVFQIRRLVDVGCRHGLGDRERLIAIFRDDALLGLALTDDRSLSQGTLSRWTLAQRRSAVRTFARLMAPELRPLVGAEPEVLVIRALRRVAERVGGGYRLTGGAPRRRGGRAPTPNEVAAIIAAASEAHGFKGVRNRAFFTLLYETGSRVNALRGLTGDAVIALSSGGLRLMLHAKGQTASREIELSERAATLLHAYIASFNRHAAVAGRCERIRIGEPGPIWRSAWGTQWAYRGVVETFAQACLAAGAAPYTLHTFRRAFATEAASKLPRHVVARAGGWQGLERLDNHYIRPRQEAVIAKLADRPTRNPSVKEARHAGSAV